MPADNPPVSHPNVFAQAANGDTAGSYYADGRYNIGGWSTYPSADALASSTAQRPVVSNQESVHK